MTAPLKRTGREVTRTGESVYAKGGREVLLNSSHLPLDSAVPIPRRKRPKKVTRELGAIGKPAIGHYHFIRTAGDHATGRNLCTADHSFDRETFRAASDSVPPATHCCKLGRERHGRDDQSFTGRIQRPLLSETPSLRARWVQPCFRLHHTDGHEPSIRRSPCTV